MHHISEILIKALANIQRQYMLADRYADVEAMSQILGQIRAQKPRSRREMEVIHSGS